MWKEIIVKVHAKDNLRALSEITGVPLVKVRPGACIELTCKAHRIRAWKWVAGRRWNLSWLWQ